MPIALTLAAAVRSALANLSSVAIVDRPAVRRLRQPDLTDGQRRDLGLDDGRPVRPRDPLRD